MSYFTVFVLVALCLQRLVELWIANRNTKALLSQGATEYGARHYPLIVAMHSAWLLALFVFGISNSIDLFWLAALIILQGMRVWVLLSLGPRWTTRVIILDAPLVMRGPYKYVNHPNYLIVIAEVFVVPMMLGLPSVAAVFSALNAAVLIERVHIEEAALARYRRAAPS